MTAKEYIEKSYVSDDFLVTYNFTYEELYKIANYNKAEEKKNDKS
jgi:hypothetical protein